MIRVEGAPPYLAVQDGGWPGLRASGMPAGGAMDRWALAVANLLAGNAAEDAALEWALGAGALRFEADAVVALAGAEAEATLGGAPAPACTALHARAGETLRIAAPSRGRFVYVAIRGGVDVPPVLGSRATYLPGAFGGLAGRLVRAGDAIPVGRAPAGPAAPHGWALPEGLRPAYDPHLPLRAVAGPQAALFAGDAWATLEGEAFRVSRTSDRAGYRLEGPALRTTVPAALPSEAACPGAVQVPDGGAPIVLMPDGPTVGGYPKIAVVASADLPGLAQRAPGDEVRFRLVSVAEAQAAYRSRAVQLHTVRETVRRAAARG
jgi:antagonist of KipI